MERLIKSLLRYAQAGQGHLDRKRVSVDQIIESVKVSLAALIAETGAQIVCDPLPAIEADPVLLEHLFQNLIGNSLQYRRPGEVPVVEISGEQSGEIWQFAVKDNGQGIPVADQEHVFEALKRLYSSDTPGTAWDWHCAALSQPAMEDAFGLSHRAPDTGQSFDLPCRLPKMFSSDGTEYRALAGMTARPLRRQWSELPRSQPLVGLGQFAITCRPPRCG